MVVLLLIQSVSFHREKVHVT
ncbi:hypothetical protein ACQ27_gp405 [Klebsiella phage K64-1]|nr:hypothetical protein ACQ27_gp405 [Klebsiella phage K64-1]